MRRLGPGDRIGAAFVQDALCNEADLGTGAFAESAVDRGILTDPGDEEFGGDDLELTR